MASMWDWMDPSPHIRREGVGRTPDLAARHDVVRMTGEVPRAAPLGRIESRDVAMICAY